LKKKRKNRGGAIPASKKPRPEQKKGRISKNVGGVEGDSWRQGLEKRGCLTGGGKKRKGGWEVGEWGGENGKKFRKR